MLLRVFGAAIFLLIIFAGRDVFALDPNKAITQYVHNIWQDELPQNSIPAIAQTRDGYIWIGTHEGLARFNGNDFIVFNNRNTPAINNNSILVLFEDKKGTIWIGTNNGLSAYKDRQFFYYGQDAGLANKIIYTLYQDREERIWIGTNLGLTCFKDGKFINYRSADGIPETLIRTIYQDSQGNVWVGTSEGLRCFRNGKFISYTTSDGLAQNYVRTIIEDQEKSLWIGTDGGLSKFQAGKFTTYNSIDGLANNLVRSLYQDHQGILWIGTDYGLSRFQNGEFTSYTNEQGLSNNLIRTIFQDRAGNLWIGTDGGLNRYQNNRITSFTNKDGLSQDFVRTIYEDREGSLWVGTNGGLNRFSDSNFTNYTTKEGLSYNFTRTVCEDSIGNIWIGVDSGGLNRLKDGKITTYTGKDGLLNDTVLALYADQDGNCWVGSRGGLSCFKNEKFTNYTTKDGLANNSVRAIYQDRTGQLWIGTEGGGLNSFKDGKFRTYTTKDGLVSNDIRVVFEDRNGVIWIGSYAGINSLKNGKFTSYSIKEGYAFGIVFDFHQDAQGNLWIGCDNGLSLYRDGKFIFYSSRVGLFDDRAFRILEDNNENLWLSSNRGISRVSKRELLDFAAGKIKNVTHTSYGKSDGMAANQCNGASSPAGWRSRDGKLWFPTVNGVTMIDPAQIRLNDLLPPVVIENIKVDGRTINSQASFNPNTEKYEFQYAALSFLAPSKIFFKYKIEGLNKDWVLAGTRRTAFYNNIPPGDYQFRVMACNSDGLWNEVGASYNFQVITPLWRTKGAYLFGLALLVLIYYVIVQLRLQTLQRRNRILDAKVTVRTAELAEKIQQLKLSEQIASEANQAKSRFLANISHELRTPLNAIIGYAQILSRKKGFKEEDYKQVSTIARSGEHLLSLINDVLSISKIEAGKFALKIEPFQPYNLFQDLIAIFNAQAKAKKLEFNYYIDPLIPQTLNGDESKLRQVLINLLNNAIKFTSAGSISLSIKWHDNRGSFEVKDTGYGIARAELTDLFEPFVQTRSGQQAKEGTGLGLHISRNIIRSMGGDISVSSELGKGTIFSFEVNLPLAESQKQLGRVIGLAAGQPVYRLLIVDDKAENRDVLNTMLVTLGFDTQQASNGEQAMEIWQQWQPDLIWLDMRMKIMDGYTAAQQIKSQSASKQVKSYNGADVIIIALTASIFEHDQQRIFDAGCDDIVIKPYHESTIFEKLSKHLGIQFQYEESADESNQHSAINKSPLETSAQLALLPNELTNQLNNAILTGRPDLINKVIDQIEKNDNGLAIKLRELANGFRLDELLDLLEKVVEQS